MRKTPSTSRERAHQASSHQQKAQADVTVAEKALLIKNHSIYATNYPHKTRLDLGIQLWGSRTWDFRQVPHEGLRIAGVGILCPKPVIRKGLKIPTIRKTHTPHVADDTASDWMIIQIQFPQWGSAVQKAWTRLLTRRCIAKGIYRFRQSKPFQRITFRQMLSVSGWDRNRWNGGNRIKYPVSYQNCPKKYLVHIGSKII